MHAECLGYRANVFNHVILFFLLHEMPPEARQRTLAEMLRVILPGGRILITEYGPLPAKHWLYRLAPFRWLTAWLEPFLPGFWHEDLDDKLLEAALKNGKGIERVSEASIFYGFIVC